MKRLFITPFTLIALLAVAGLATSEQVGTGFTYQGHYEVGGVPVNGTADLYFSLWDAHTGGNRIGEVQQRPGVEIVDGVFNTIINEEEEFGPDAFVGEARWLEIWVCGTPGCVSPEVLAPRQPLTSTPYATWARSAPWSGLEGVPAGFADNVDNSGDSLWEENGSDISYNAGKVGVGSDTPHHQLRISGGPPWTSNGWTGSLELDNGAAIGWRPNGAGRLFGIGHTFGGLHFFNTDSVPGAATSEAEYAMTITDAGLVGIGTTAPSAKFQVNDGRIRVGDTMSGNRWDLFQTNNGNLFKIEQNAAFSNFAIVGGAEGRVGIGTDTPAANSKLHVLNSQLNTIGVTGEANGSMSIGVYGKTNIGSGVYGIADTGYGVYGVTPGGIGVAGRSNTNYGVEGTSIDSAGVSGVSTTSDGVSGVSGSGRGVYGHGGSINGTGVYGEGAAFGIFGRAIGGAWAGYFDGPVDVEGDLWLGGEFHELKSNLTLRIDHPLDPENKILSHTSVKSPEMKNVYDGVVVTDEKGYAEVSLPDWFEALNRDFRYQLTVIDEADSAGFVHAKVVKEIQRNTFTIRSSQPNTKVSWQVTGIRNDPYAKANPLEVEKVKPENERGKYLAPEVYGQPKEMGIHYRPEIISDTRKASIE
jgi:hypothetical protein